MFGYQKNIKRAIDILMSALLLVFCVPIMLFIYLIVLITEGRPVIFCQKRLGKHNKPFVMFKFRTLKLKKFENFSFSEGDLIFPGRFLRRTGLDELPQLLNVLKGDMSLVGPRPLPVEYLSRLIDHPRSTVSPGLTGVVQISGDNDLPWNTRFFLDRMYIKNICLIQDARILFRTLLTPLCRKRLKGCTTKS